MTQGGGVGEYRGPGAQGRRFSTHVVDALRHGRVLWRSPEQHRHAHAGEALGILARGPRRLKGRRGRSTRHTLWLPVTGSSWYPAFLRMRVQRIPALTQETNSSMGIGDPMSRPWGDRIGHPQTKIQI